MESHFLTIPKQPSEFKKLLSHSKLTIPTTNPFRNQSNYPVDRLNSSPKSNYYNKFNSNMNYKYQILNNRINTSKPNSSNIDIGNFPTQQSQKKILAIEKMDNYKIEKYMSTTRQKVNVMIDNTVETKPHENDQTSKSCISLTSKRSYDNHNNNKPIIKEQNFFKRSLINPGKCIDKLNIKQDYIQSTLMNTHNENIHKNNCFLSQKISKSKNASTDRLVYKKNHSLENYSKNETFNFRKISEYNVNSASKRNKDVNLISNTKDDIQKKSYSTIFEPGEPKKNVDSIIKIQENDKQSSHSSINFLQKKIDTRSISTQLLDKFKANRHQDIPNNKNFLCTRKKLEYTDFKAKHAMETTELMRLTNKELINLKSNIDDQLKNETEKKLEQKSSKKDFTFIASLKSNKSPLQTDQKFSKISTKAIPYAGYEGSENNNRFENVEKTVQDLNGKIIEVIKELKGIKSDITQANSQKKLPQNEHPINHEYNTHKMVENYSRNSLFRNSEKKPGIFNVLKSMKTLDKKGSYGINNLVKNDYDQNTENTSETYMRINTQNSKTATQYSNVTDPKNFIFTTLENIDIQKPHKKFENSFSDEFNYQPFATTNTSNDFEYKKDKTKFEQEISQKIRNCTMDSFNTRNSLNQDVSFATLRQELNREVNNTLNR